MNKEATVTKQKLSAGQFYKKYGLFIILGVMVVVMAFANSNFMSVANWQNIMRQMSVNGLLAIGVTFIILTGGIDLSIGSIVGFAGIMTALVAQNHELPLIVPLLVGCACGAGLGAVNGLLVGFLRIPAFITTLGMVSIARGLTFIMCDARPVAKLMPAFLEIGKGNVGGIPIPMIILIVCFVIASIVLYKMRYGRYIYAIGGNREAAITSGLKVRVLEMSTYLIAGLMAGLAAIVYTSRVTSGLPQAGEGYELDAIAASVIGGVSLSGGEGKLWGTLIGAVILAVIQNALDIMVVSSYYQLIIKGALIVGAVYIDRLTKAGDK
ncbi:MAG: ABC transporter permease [Christensenellaceae bacterium]|jgi:inositol transport system permease protein